MQRAANLFATIGRWFVPALPAEANETPRSFAHRRYREFFTNTFRAVVWLAIWGGAGIAPTVVLTQGHKTGAQVGIGLAVYLVCTILVLGIPYGASRLTAPGTLLSRERLERVGERQGHTLALGELNRRNAENEQSWREAFERKSVETEHLRGLLGKAESTITTLEAAATAHPTIRELGAIADLNRERVVRANVVSVMDELAHAKQTITHAIDEHGGFWNQELHWQVWENVRDSLAPEKGFHAAYAATRDAYDAIQQAEVSRLNHDGAQSDTRSWEEQRIQTALDDINKADTALTRFLGNMDV